MSRTFRTTLLVTAASALLAGCTADPFERPGTVAPRGFNDANLRLMMADPAHLRYGVDAPASRGDAGSRPVDLLRSGKRPALPATSTGISIGGGGGN